MEFTFFLLSQGLDDLGTTLGECLGRTQWSSPLDLATYLYYFTSGCVPIITWSHVLPEHSIITWQGHVIWLPNLPCYSYLDPIIWLDIRDQMFECVGNSFLSGALITFLPSHTILIYGVVSILLWRGSDVMWYCQSRSECHLNKLLCTHQGGWRTYCSWSIGRQLEH